MIVTHKENGGLVILGKDQERFLDRILAFVVNYTEEFSESLTRTNVENLRNDLGLGE